MKPFAIRILEVPMGGGKALRVLTAYLQRRCIPYQQFSGELVTLLSTQSGFDLICFIGQEQSLAQARDWISEGSIRERLAQATANALDATTYFVSFDGVARQCRITNSSDSCDLPSDFFIRLRRASMMGIFSESDGLVDAPRGTHYQKPSGKHTGQFIRVARVLESNLHVSEVAFWLLPVVAKCGSISQILVDTSGILATAYVLAYEAVRHGWSDDLPVVASHNSYEGLATLVIKDPASTVCLISASTSGELEECLSRQGIPDSNIVTLYLLGSRANNTRDVLCDLTRHDTDNPSGYLSISSYSEVDCQLCARKSLPIRVSGDQFVLEQPIIREIDIRKTDLTQRDLLDAFAATGFFKVFRSTGSEQFEIYLDIAAFFSGSGDLSEGDDASSEAQYQPTTKLRSDLRAKLQAYIRRGLPVHAKRIVYGSHPYSKELAEAAEQIFRQFQDSSSLQVMTTQDLPAAEKMSQTATLVIGSCFAGARELMTINMLLRGVQPQGNTTYVALVYRSEAKTERERVRNSVTFGEFDAETFNFYAAANIFLPNCAREHSWYAELDLLVAIQSQAELDGSEIPVHISDRIHELRGAPRIGLEDNLFWPSVSGQPLRIQHDFVFISTKGRVGRISQADVYVVVASLLHDLRLRADDRQLIHGPYKRSLLSADNFLRFNDPIVQAAILRAVRGYELCYGNCAESSSLSMKRIVEEAIASAELRKPECLMEFLIAMATNRLTLYREHIAGLCEAVLGADLPVEYKLVANYLLTRIT